MSTGAYFFEYTLHRKDLISLAYAWISSRSPRFFAAWVCRWTSKRNVWVLGLLGMVVGQLIVYLGVRQEFLPLIMARLDIWFSRQRRGHGDAVLRALRQRGLRRMEDRHSRGRVF